MAYTEEQLTQTRAMIKAVCEPFKRPSSWKDVANTRSDYLYGRAQAELLRKAGHGAVLRRLWKLIEPIDYSRDIAGNKEAAE